MTHPSAETLERLASRSAVTGLFVAAGMAGISWIGFLLGLSLTALACLLDARTVWSALRHRWLLWLPLALTLYILVQTPLAVREFPILARNTYPDWTHLLAISGLASVIAGYWLSRRPDLYRPLLAVTGAGIAVGLAVGIQWQNLWVSGMGVRRDWGYLPEEVGLLSAIGLLGCTVMLLRVLSDRGRSALKRAGGALAWLLAALAFAVVLYGSQTRATWIAAAVLTALYLLWHLAGTLRRRSGIRSTLAAAGLLVVATVGLLQLDDAERLEQRLGGGQDTMAALLTLDREGVYRSNPSLGVRLNMWVEALRAYGQRPVFGWGIGAKVVTDTQAQLDVGWRQPQYHNLYLEFLLGLGVIGFGLFTAICGLLAAPLLRRLAGRDTSHHPPPPVRTILGLSAALTAFAVLFELQVGNPSGRAVIVWLMAMLAGLALMRPPARSSSPA